MSRHQDGAQSRVRRKKEERQSVTLQWIAKSRFKQGSCRTLGNLTSLITELVP
jgi:hypothetical protein